MSQEEFLLKWNDHHTSFFNIVEELCRTEQLCDVTLACGGQVFETHKLILSVCSPYFRTLLNRQDKHPIIYLKDVNPQHLEQLLSYMYRGEINVLQNDLGPLIETARGLQIKGLADAGGGGEKKAENGGSQPHHPPKPLIKRAKPHTPIPTQAKVPKLDPLPKISPEVTPDVVEGDAPVVTEPYVVKVEEDGWIEDSIPSESYESDLSKDYDQELKKSYEHELQMEDEQYIQPEGLTGQQIMMLQKEIQKKYSCEFCHKRFPTPSKLNRHKLVHSGEKPYHCVMCSKGFTQKVHLNTHTKLAHPDPTQDQFGYEIEHQEMGQLTYSGFNKKIGIEDSSSADDQGGYAGSDSENSLFIHTEPMEG